MRRDCTFEDLKGIFGVGEGALECRWELKIDWSLQ